ncbi:MAG: DUF11 domain-containing protein [Anaerolineae bacterium]|nr:DUF11 domain-containing protein [Anaerolineae bacterium]
MKLQRLLHVLAISLALLIATLVGLQHLQPISQAQSGDIIVTKALNRPNNVVRVGDILSFTITVTNQSAFTLTNVTITDTFDSSILQFNQAVPTEDSVSGSVIRWDNVAVLNNPAGMQVGDVVTLTVFFRAVHPQDAVVNAVEGGDIIRDGSQSGNGANGQTDPEPVVGGRAPVFKAMEPPDSTPVAGLPVTFTHIITNDSGAILTQLALTDTYDANFLEFNAAFPFTPNITSPIGTLVWTDLATTSYFGPLQPDTAIIITTVFTALTQVVDTVNQAETGNARDEFSNDVTGDAFQVPITVIDNPDTGGGDNGDDTTTDDSDDDDDDDDDQTNIVAPTATLATPATATPMADFITPTAVLTVQQTLTDSDSPRFLPETGLSKKSPFPWWLVGLTTIGLVLAAWLLAKRQQTP